MRCIAALIAAAMLWAFPAFAQETMIDGSDPAAIARVAERYGSARVDRDPGGDPLVIGKLGQTVYIIQFFGCAGGRNCGSIRFRASYARPGLSDDNMGEWNRTERFLKAFLDEEGDPVIHMSVNLVGGVTERNLAAVFDRWTSFAGQFEEFIGWQP